MTAVSIETSSGPATASTRDLSEGGALLQCSKPLRAGDALRMQVTAPGYGVPMLVDGVVLRSAGRSTSDTLLPHRVVVAFDRPLHDAALPAA